MSGQLPAGWKDKLPKFTPEVRTYVVPYNIHAQRCFIVLAAVYGDETARDTCTYLQRCFIVLAVLAVYGDETDCSFCMAYRSAALLPSQNGPKHIPRWSGGTSDGRPNT